MPFASSTPSDRYALLYALDSRLTIRETPSSPAVDPHALALSALGWVLSDEPRADRLLALTGLTPDVLRDGLDNPAVLGAVIEFLCTHEPDLIAASEALGVEPQELVAAKRGLES